LSIAFTKGTILLSYSVLVEIYEVLTRKQFRRYVVEEDVRAFLAALTRQSHWVDVVTRITACRDPSDDKLLELAVDGHASHIVTGDSDLLVLHPFRGIQIVPPHAFLRMFDTANESD